MIPDKEPVNTWDGNSSNITFDFDFLINSVDELLVLHTDKTGIQNTLKLNIDYTIHQTGNANGSYITFPILGSSYKTLGEGEKITLMLNIPIAQTSPYGTSDKLNLKSLEFSLDYIVRLIQMVNRKVERSVKVQEGSSTTPDDLIESLNQAQMNAQNFATIASNKANEANTSAMNAQSQATIAAQMAENTKNTYTTAMKDIQNAVEYTQDRLSGFPYARACINFGSVDENGEPDLLSYDEDTQTVTVKSPFVYTTVSGKTYECKTDLSIVLDETLTGNVRIWVDKNDEAFYLKPLSNNIFIQKSEPDDAKENDVWINTSVAPETQKIKTSLGWEIFEGVEIGSVRGLQGGGGGVPYEP